MAAVERLSLALGILSDAFTMNILRLVEPDVTHLSRFLAAPGNTGHSFGAVQKAFVALNTENRTLAMPVSLNSVAVAGNIEDRATQLDPRPAAAGAWLPPTEAVHGPMRLPIRYRRG